MNILDKPKNENKKINIPSDVKHHFKKESTQPKEIVQECIDFYLEYNNLDSKQMKNIENPSEMKKSTTEYNMYRKIANKNLLKIIDLHKTASALGCEVLSNLCTYAIANAINEKSYQEIDDMINKSS